MAVGRMGTLKELIRKKTIVVIAGPTASGKTECSIYLGKLADIEIISADSRQIYKYMDIGTAKPTKSELNEARHHYIDIVNPDKYYSAGLYGNNAAQTANEILKKGMLPVVVGGSGLYIKALCEGLFMEGRTPESSAIRTELENRLKESGIDSLYIELQSVDPASALSYPDKNPRRIIRALAYYYTNGKPISEDWKTYETKRNFNVLYFGILWDREELYSRINLRTEIMWESGLVNESEKLLSMGYNPGLNALNTVGYKETLAFLNNEISKDQAISLIKQNTRRYAKRQLTWFRKIPNINWIQGNPADIAHNIYKQLSEKG